MDALNLGDEQIALAEKGADREFIGGGTAPQDSAGEVDGAQGQVGEQWGGEIDFPSLGLHLDHAADDEVADFRGISSAEGANGEEFVGFLQSAGDAGEDGGRRGGGGRRSVGAMASDGAENRVNLDDSAVQGLRGDGLDFSYWISPIGCTCSAAWSDLCMACCALHCWVCPPQKGDLCTTKRHEMKRNGCWSYLIHCGSSVTLSPGVMMALLERCGGIP